MSKIQDFMDKRNLFFWSLSISPWASFVTWLHLEALVENTKKINEYLLSNIKLVLTHTVSELGVLGIAGKPSMPSITLCKKFKKKLKFIAQGLLKIQSIQFRLIGTLRINILYTKIFCLIKFFNLQIAMHYFKLETRRKRRGTMNKEKVNE